MHIVRHKHLTTPMRPVNQHGVAFSLVRVKSVFPVYPHLRPLPESVIHLQVQELWPGDCGVEMCTPEAPHLLVVYLFGQRHGCPSAKYQQFQWIVHVRAALKLVVRLVYER